MNNAGSPPWKLLLIAIAINFLLVVTLGYFYYSSKGNSRIVYIDSFKLFSNYKGALKAKKEYDHKVSIWKANVDTLTSEFNAAVGNHEKAKATMSAKERKLSEELLVRKRSQLEEYRAAISKNAADEDQQMTSKLTAEINSFIKEYGEAHDFEFILGATNAGNVVFAKAGRDITETVLQELNRSYDKGNK